MSWHFSTGRRTKQEAIESFRKAELCSTYTPRGGHLAKAAEALLVSVPDGVYISISSHGYSNSDGSGGAMVSVTVAAKE